MNHAFFPEAHVEFIQNLRHYKEHSILTAHRFLADFEQHLERIKKNPLRRPEDKYGTRRQNLKRYPYSIIYLINDNTLWIVAVVHHHQKPYYWKKRLPS